MRVTDTCTVCLYVSISTIHSHVICIFHSFIAENDDFDPIPVPEVLTIPANFTKICFNVIIKDDPMVEKTETFLISVVFPPNQPALQSGEITATGNGNGTINILDDDGEHLCICIWIQIWIGFWNLI